MPAEIETMFTRLPAWHSLGTVTDQALTSADAIKTAGLDWTVTTRPLVTFDADNGQAGFIEVPDHYATVRDSDMSVLGVVGNRYTPIQNQECFDFMDTVVDEDGITYETAGSLYDGRVVWMLLNLNRPVQVDEDITHNYMLLTNSHDGSSSLKGLTTPIRVVCANTLRLAIRDRKNGFSFRHTSNLKGKVLQARASLNLTYEYIDSFQEEMEKLLDTEITDAYFNEIMDDVMPIPLPTTENVKAVTRVTNQRNEIEKLFLTPEFSTHKNTAWALINATSNYEQWKQSIRGNVGRENRIAQKTVMGTESPITAKVYASL